MVLNNLGYRPIRTALSVLAVTIEVVLILSVVGLVHGLLEERAARQQGIGADIVVQSSTASKIIGMTTGPQLPVSIAGKLQEVPGVTAVTPVYWQTQGGLTIVWGVDVDSFNAVTGGLTVLSGRIIRPVTQPLSGEPCAAAPSPCEIMIDDIQAGSENPPLKVGDNIPLWNNNFKLVGIVASGKGARLYVPLRVAQALNDGGNRCTLFYVKLTDPKNGLKPALERFKEMLPDYQITSLEEIYSLMVSGNIPGVKPFESIMIGIAVVIGFLVIFMALYTAVLERTREIGTLKAMGASKGYIVGLVLRETTLVSVIGDAIGIVAFIALRYWVMKAHPDLNIQVTIRWMVLATVIAIAGSIVGAAYPALRAARQDPIEALAYE